MAEFGMLKSFHIDNGELDGLRLNEAFTLGYELAMIDALIDLGVPFNRPVHSANRERIEESFAKAGRECELTWMHTDTSEEWMWLHASAVKVDKLPCAIVEDEDAEGNMFSAIVVPDGFVAARRVCGEVRYLDETNQ